MYTNKDVVDAYKEICDMIVRGIALDIKYGLPCVQLLPNALCYTIELRTDRKGEEICVKKNVDLHADPECYINNRLNDKEGLNEYFNKTSEILREEQI